jgi:hypothetical protein
MKELSVQWKSGGGTGKKSRAGDESGNADAEKTLEGMRALKLA